MRNKSRTTEHDRGLQVACKSHPEVTPAWLQMKLSRLVPQHSPSSYPNLADKEEAKSTFLSFFLSLGYPLRCPLSETKFHLTSGKLTVEMLQGFMRQRRLECQSPPPNGFLSLDATKISFKMCCQCFFRGGGSFLDQKDITQWHICPWTPSWSDPILRGTIFSLCDEGSWRCSPILSFLANIIMDSSFLACKWSHNCFSFSFPFPPTRLSFFKGSADSWLPCNVVPLLMNC